MKSRKDGSRQKGKSVWGVGVLLGLSLWLNLEASVFAQLNEHCTVSVLNRTAQVRASGRWRLPDVPANMGRVRARATCIENGLTRSGQSDFFTVPVNGRVVVPQIVFATTAPIPASIRITAPTFTLTELGSSIPLTVTAAFADGGAQDVTAGSKGTNYTNSNPKVVTVSPDGVVTAVASGTVIISAQNEGALGLIRLQVVLPSGDSDGDGIPDDVERANGLNPNDPTDGFTDLDGDGLTNKQELVDFGTDPRVADTDGDGLADGQEVLTYHTNPLLADTDGDGVSDGVEIANGSNPLDPNSRPTVKSLTVSPANFVLTVNTIIGEASRQLGVTGQWADGRTINVTNDPGTSYTSSDLNICNFGAERGRIFAGANGTCTITVSNSGLSAQANITVETFAPTALTFVDLPGATNNVDVNGNFAYVAAGAAGLQIVNIANRSAPVIAGSLDTPGNAQDVQIVDNFAYVADGASGLQIIDVTDPSAPVSRGTLDTPDNAQDVVVKGSHAFVADGASGLQIIDVTNPQAPTLLGSVDTPGSASGVDVDLQRNLAVVADGTSGIQVIDITDITRPTIIGSLDTGNAADVAVRDGFAFVADLESSFTTVDLSDPRNPILRASTPRATGGLLNDVALTDRFAFGADIFFVNGAPIIDISTPTNPLPRAILDFSSFGDDNGTGIAVDSAYVYLTTDQHRLFIGQYLQIEDTAGIPPIVRISSPTVGDSVIEGASLPITVEATDDIAVAAVKLLVNGAVVAVDTSSPYQFTIPVPTGVTSLTLGATALDFGGNVGAAQNISLAVIPDPGTTVVGQVVDQKNNPVSGANVTCRGVSGLTVADGSFSLSGVPSVRGDIQCLVKHTEPALKGLSLPVAPTSGGNTEMGPITASAITFAINSTADAVDAAPGDGVCATSDGVCTLRAAIQEANAHAGDDGIDLPAGMYTLTIPSTDFEDASTNGDLDITANLILIGDGAAATIIQACAPTTPETTCTGINRVLDVDPAQQGISVQISGVTVRNGHIDRFADHNGGGLRNRGRLTLTVDSISGNTTANSGGGSDGGGISNEAGTLTLVNSSVNNNTCNSLGGGIVNGDGATLILTNSIVSGNRAGSGGGVWSGFFDVSNPSNTKVIVTNSTISGNTAGDGGGLVMNRGALTLTNSIVSSNTTTGVGGVFGVAAGGGVILGNFNNGLNVMKNCTISNNSGRGSGGGIATLGAPLALNNCTISGNTAQGIRNARTGTGGGIAGAAALANTIVAGNTADAGQPQDCAASLTSQGYNLIQDTTGCAITGVTTGNITGQAPLLGSLADNGGRTQTRALLLGSPAIDAGNPATPGSAGPACEATDQRGVSRPQPGGGRCDIGAYERGE